MGPECYSHRGRRKHQTEQDLRAAKESNVSSVCALQALKCMARRIDVVPVAFFKGLFGLSSRPAFGREVEIVLHR